MSQHPNFALLSTKDDFHDTWQNVHGYITTKAEISPLPLPPSLTRSDKATDPTNPTMPPGWHRGEADYEPFFRAQSWSWFSTATKHYGSSGLEPRLGESRVKLATCGILNYFSPEFQSQALPRATYGQKELNLTHEGLWLGLKKTTVVAALRH